MQALHDIVKDGHARYIGMSSCWAWQFQLMQRQSRFVTREMLIDRIRYSEPIDSVHLDAELP
jgi:aryl-alcohol dehydrogenase-like predicted oxidoreductase